MPGKHEVELFISEDGELKVHVKGMKGPGCVNVLESISKQLGQEVNRELTGEYYESVKEQAENKIKEK